MCNDHHSRDNDRHTHAMLVHRRKNAITFFSFFLPLTACLCALCECKDQNISFSMRLLRDTLCAYMQYEYQALGLFARRSFDDLSMHFKPFSLYQPLSPSSSSFFFITYFIFFRFKTVQISFLCIIIITVCLFRADLIKLSSFFLCSCITMQRKTCVY